MHALMLGRADDRLQQLKYEAPASWNAEAKLAFWHLPLALQVYYVAREKQRDREVRRCQSEAADLRREVKELKLELKTLKDINPGKTDGTSENCTPSA
jgi:hypothetical protein